MITEEFVFEISSNKSNVMDNIWAHFDNKIANIKTTSTSSAMVIVMVRQYLEMSLLERTKNPFEFWSKHKNLFPEIYEMAMKYMCIPATSVPSKTVFSKSGQITSSRRNRLLPKNVGSAIYLHSQM